MFMLFLSTTVGYAMRVNLSIAIVDMTDNVNCTEDNCQKFDWDELLKTVILSSFFWGWVWRRTVSWNAIQVKCLSLSLSLQVCGASDTERASRAEIRYKMAVILGDGDIVDLYRPHSNCSYHIRLGRCLRLTGDRRVRSRDPVPVHPCRSRGLGSARRKRSPLLVRFFRFALSCISRQCASDVLDEPFTGSQIGTIVTFAVSGYLATTSIGWALIFYVFGGLGFVWCALWFCVASSSPAEHSFISDKERNYIERSISKTEMKATFRTPWKELAKSVPM